MNIGRLYEGYINAASREVKRSITKTVNGRDVSNISNDEVVNIFNIGMEFLSLLDNEQFTTYTSLLTNQAAMRDIIVDVMDKEFYTYLPVDNDVDMVELTKRISNSKFFPTKENVSYIINGEPKTSDTKIAIVPMYIMLLSKLGDTWLSTASSKVNHYGIPIGLSKANKHRVPWSDNPTKTISETEGRILASYAGRVALAEMKDRANSMDTHKLIYDKILAADVPTNIDKSIDRDVHPYGGDDSLNIVETIMKSGGCTMKYVDENEED